MGILQGIAYRHKSKGDMQVVEAATVTRDKGVETDFRGKPNMRQVTVLSAEDWQETCDELNVTLHWSTRRSNLLVSGIRFSAASVGDVIQIGDLHLKITRETDPCRRMDALYKGLKKALQPAWRGGVCCRVIASGDIALGDSVVVIDKE